jgi:hypothetical protein
MSPLKSIAVVLLGLLAAATASAQVPPIIAYQGRIAVGGTNFTGGGLFKFALVNSNGTASFWSHDGTSAAGSQPSGSLTLPTTNGLYAVLLGDTSLAGMLPVPPTVFTNSDVRLRIWFSNGSGFQQLSPDQRIAAVGYALMAASVNDGAITTAKLADGAVTSAKIGSAAVTSVHLAPNSVTASSLAFGSVTSNSLSPNLSLGNSFLPASLQVYATATGTPGVSLLGSAGQVSTYGSDGLEQTRLWGSSFGELQLNDNIGNDTTVMLSANYDNGGSLQLFHSNFSSRVYLAASSSAGDLRLSSTNAQLRTQLHGGSDGSYLNLYAADGSSGLYLDGDTSGGGSVSVRNTNSSSRVALVGQGSNGGGSVTVYAGDGSTTIQAQGDDGAGAGILKINNNISQNRVTLSGEGTGTGGEITLGDADGTSTLELQAAETSTTGASLKLRNAAGSLRAELDGDYFSGASLYLYGSNNNANIILDSNSSGEGRITCDVLQINGGSDLSEKFNINPAPVAAAREPEPGQLVCIDPARPGQLVTSSQPYDRTVAGVISGAGGVKPGMLMGQAGTAADGRQPVALTGRVYCWVDADHGAITPGDLLTTSATPGHAMKVADHARAQGAIIGKAMSALPKGKGLVLVLVSLQ